MAHQVSAALLNTRNGLSGQEAAERLRKFGPNNILIEQKKSWSKIVTDTARDPMPWFLVATSALFYWVGDTTEAAVMAFAILPILGMDAFLHFRTAASTESLAGQLALKARVIRDGAAVSVPSRDLVPGDLVDVITSESFPADGIIIEGAELQVDESTLTGESLPARKMPFDSVALFVPDHQWVSAGTRLLSGEARVLIAQTGGNTLYGQIVRSAEEATHQPTALQQAVNRLLYMSSIGSIVLCVALAAIRFWQGHGLQDALVSGVTLAVAALPEEFPVALTFLIGLGVYRMARQKALVKRAAAVENIGRVTVVCSDKTGTITEGKLTLVSTHPTGKITHERLLSLIASASRRESADPLDMAILAKDPNQMGKVVAVYPFTENRRREVITRQSGKRFICCMKGAPETVAGHCKLTAAQRREFQSELGSLAALGRKVIAVAFLETPRMPKSEPQSGFILAGLVSFEDPVRSEVPQAIADIRKSGIKIILVTGDHEATAKAIAAQAGIGGANPRVISGEQLADIIAKGQAIDFDVIARANPMQKLDLVKALKQRGETVAVTGDGVNDVPALNGADISIAMGERGTGPAREAAMIVLMNDSFATIAHAIQEGRAIFQNLRASFAYLMLLHIPLVLTAAIVPFAGYPLLFLPIHVVLLELVIHPTVMLAFLGEAQHVNHTSEVPRLPPSHIFVSQEFLLIFVAGAWLSAAIIGGFIFALGPDQNVAHGRTFGFSVLVLSSSLMTWALNRFRFDRLLAVPILMLAGLAIAMFEPHAAGLLHLTPLHANDLLFVFLATLPALVIARQLIVRSAGTQVSTA